MKNFIIKSLIFLFIVTSFQLKAQDRKEFDKDSTLFIGQFEEFINRNLSESKEDSLKIFIERWNTGYFSNEIKDRFINVCNFMLKNKARRDPHFTEYFEMVMAFHHSGGAMKQHCLKL